MNHSGSRSRRGRTGHWNIFEKILKDNFPNLAKDIDFQEVQESQRVSKNLDRRKHTPRHSIITRPKIKDEERTLKVARGKGDSYLQRSSYKIISPFLKRSLAGKKGLQRSIQSWKARVYIQDHSLQQSYHWEWKGRERISQLRASERSSSSSSPFYGKCYRDLSKKKIKNVNSKMTTTLQLSRTEPETETKTN